jgi:hypothetical protein
MENVMTDPTFYRQRSGSGSLDANGGMQWYVVHAYSGMEKAVERNITNECACRDGV